jgi:DNA helicase-2/ATP-dependent DNA helicase PcrA
MAVLYRSHFHAMELQLELTKRNIPFAITSGIRVFEQAHIKDVTAYLKLVYNPSEEPSFKRIARMLPGVGNKAADKLWQQYLRELSAFKIAGGTEAAAPPRISTAAALRKCAPLVPKKAVSGWKQLNETFEQLEADEIRRQPAEMIRLVLEAGYENYLQETYPNYRARQEDLEQLAVFSGQFPSLEEFLTQLSLLTNLEAEGDQARSRDDEKIRLTTVHQAKGLEWDVVFVIMLCENVSVATLIGKRGRRRGGAPPVLCGDHARPQRAVLELPLPAFCPELHGRHLPAALALPERVAEDTGGRMEIERVLSPQLFRSQSV